MFNGKYQAYELDKRVPEIKKPALTFGLRGLKVWIPGLLLSAIAFSGARGARLTEELALERLSQWMSAHPVMHVAAERPVSSIAVFPADGASYFFYAVSFEPGGYAIINSDDRLPPVTAFSPSSTLDLADVPGNALRSALEAHADSLAVELQQEREDEADAQQLIDKSLEVRLLDTQIFGPYLDTTWNQNHPYNLYAPEDTVNPRPYYGHRVPAGCVPAAFSTVLNFHRWPLYGTGSRSYIDDQGSITGSHSAAFAEPFAWDAMRPAYDPWSDSQPGDEAVADLFYRMAVAAGADYESDGTSAAMGSTGSRLAQHFFFESVSYHDSQTELLAPLNDDLMAGFPAVVGVPGHAVVADGLLIENATESYHIDYGWGGVNNGWWTADNVAGDPLNKGCISIRPALMPFPAAGAIDAVEGEVFELEWILPRRREQEASRLLLLEMRQQQGNWGHGADSFDHATALDWVVRAGEGQDGGDCWYAGPGGYAALILDDVLVPDAATQLSFWMQYRLGSAAFTLSVSTNAGRSFIELFRRSDNYPLSWQHYSVDLGAYAGLPLQVKLELHHGSAYQESGGVWIDQPALSGGNWFRWVPLIEYTDPPSRRFEETRTLWDDCGDFSLFEVTSTSDYKDWSVATEDESTCFYKQAGGYSNREYHLTSKEKIQPSESTRLLLHWKRSLYEDVFRILVSADGGQFTEIWAAGGIFDWQEDAVSLADYAGQSIYVRLEYLPAAYYAEGGVWVDGIFLQEVINPDLEGQPVHYTAVEDMGAGYYTMAAAIEDHDRVVHRTGPAFELEVRPVFETEIVGGTVTVTGYNGPGDRIVIPPAVGGMPVTGIAAYAFDGAQLTSVVMPAGIDYLADGAFSGAAGPLRIYFHGDAPAAGSGAFGDAEPTLYYTTGSSGWSDPFAGRPAVPWNAVIRPAGAVADAGGTPGYSLRLDGPPGHHALVEACDNLGAEEEHWHSVGECLFVDGTATFEDEEPGQPACRVYRAVVPIME